jgi:hypothetical protein
MRIASLAPVTAFADRVHLHEWCVRGLPDELGARIFVGDAGPSLLGAAIEGRRRVIGLSTRIIGTPLELPVLAHECSHLLLGHGAGCCSVLTRLRCSDERNATYGSSLLAIPTESAVALVERRATVHELAATYEVPPALVYMRGALAVLLAETDGNRERARQQLAASRRSLESWMAWTARGI